MFFPFGSVPFCGRFAPHLNPSPPAKYGFCMTLEISAIKELSITISRRGLEPAASFCA